MHLYKMNARKKWYTHTRVHTHMHTLREGGGREERERLM